MTNALPTHNMIAISKFGWLMIYSSRLNVYFIDCPAYDFV